MAPTVSRHDETRERSPMKGAKRVVGIAAGIATVALVSLCTPANAVDLSGTSWERAAQAEGIDPYLLFSVALVESARHENRMARPWPWALNGPSGSFYGVSRGEAEERLRRMSQDDLSHTAVGMMQIYVGAHGNRVSDPADLLDPGLNLRMGASILRESIASQPRDFALGIGRYNAWQDERAARAYGQRVLVVYKRLKNLGGGLTLFSLWTD